MGIKAVDLHGDLIQVWSVSTALPRPAPMKSWATVPTTISDMAVAMRNQMDSSVAISANPSQSAATESISVDGLPPTHQIAHREASVVARRGLELGRHAAIEQSDALAPDEVEHPLRLVVGYQKLDLHGRVPGELEEVVLVQNSVTTESGRGTERRTSVYTDLPCLFEQPFVEQPVAVFSVLVHVEPKIRSLHRDSLEAAPRLIFGAAVSEIDRQTTRAHASLSRSRNRVVRLAAPIAISANSRSFGR